jgi:hypothetical protein
MEARPSPPGQYGKAFSGVTSGPTDSTPSATSTEKEFLATQIAVADMKITMDCCTADAIEAKKTQKLEARKKRSSVDKAIKPDHLRGHPEVFLLWLAARI